ncbi:MAG TPA: 4Fe-4S single cluster domain-containing protein [Thermoanaerobaculia bacterium]|nr:4Fe-4S single cluster domain-containing protein [Thermoanaerobaculia bacterium]
MTIPETNGLYPDFGPDLNVAEIGVVTGAAGPGRRLVVWLQGCAKRCPGCANGPYLPIRAARRVPVAEIAALLAATADCAGITLSGGEPLLQAAPLVPLLEMVRNRGLTTVCYTGYTQEELMGPVATGFLSLVDLLIDGEYRRELGRGGVYRPSSNQRLHFLSGRIRPADCEAVAETVMEIGGARATVTGTLPVALRRLLRDRLRERGITTGL